MNAEQHEARIKRLFAQAKKLPAEERARFLELAGRQDPPEVRQAVETILASDSRPEPRQERTNVNPTAAAMRLNCPHCHNPIELVVDPADELVCPSCGSSFRLDAGRTQTWSQDHLPKLGKFELLDRLGIGAFGAVYKAYDSELKRTVAVKIPRSGTLSGPEDEDRFLREARNAAQLRHAGIVPVFEVGRSGLFPFIVSELVEGVTLADALSGRRFSFQESAELVKQVALALDYSHKQGVVHRDLKPSNIMLSAEGAPRIMDFGLAKREAGEITMTIEGQVLGTPAYMSPEQADGKSHAVDGRSDVYSLGVILFELLTGELPFRGNQRMLLHQVIHAEPRAPRSLNDRIPRDLETICQKAMAKEPERRYAKAADFAADLGRYLLKQPIVARPVGRIERAWRWSKRNAVVAALSATVMIALATGAIVSTLFAIRAAAREAEAINERNRAEDETTRADKKTAEAIAQKERADNEKSTAQEATNILVGLFQGADPIGLGGYNLGAVQGIDINAKATELLDRGADYVQKNLQYQPELQAKLLNSIGEVYTSHFKFDAAEPLLKKSLEIRQRRFGPRDTQVADSLHSLAVFHFLEGDFEGCENCCREALSIRQENFGQRDLKVALSQFVLGWDLMFSSGARSGESEAIIRAALNTRLELLGEDHRDVGLTRLALAFSLFKNNQPALGPVELAKALVVLQKTGGDTRATEALSLYIAGLFKRQLGQQAAAAKDFTSALQLVAGIFGASHPVANYLKCELADFQFAGHDDAAAERIYREAMESNLQVIGRRPFVARDMDRLAMFLADRGRYDDAEKLLSEAMEIRVESLGKEHGQVAALWTDRALIAERRGDLKKASESVTVAMRIYSKTNPAIYGQNLWHAAEWMSRLALYFDDERLYREACRELVKSYPSFNDRREPQRADRCAWVCAILPDTVDDPTIVVKIAEDAFAAHPANYWLCRSLGAALYRAGKTEESLRRFEQALQIKGDDGEISIWLFLAMANHQAGHRDKAQEWLDKARTWLASRLPELQSTAIAAPPSGDGRVNPEGESTVAADKKSVAVQPLPWHDGATFKHLLLEAESLMSKPAGRTETQKRG